MPPLSKLASPGSPTKLSDIFAVRKCRMGESARNLEAYLSKMVDLLRMDGVRFPDNKQKKFTRLDAIYATGSSAGIHAEGRWVNLGETDNERRARPRSAWCSARSTAPSPPR